MYKPLHYQQVPCPFIWMIWSSFCFHALQVNMVWLLDFLLLKTKVPVASCDISSVPTRTGRPLTVKPSIITRCFNWDQNPADSRCRPVCSDWNLHLEVICQPGGPIPGCLRCVSLIPHLDSFIPPVTLWSPPSNQSRLYAQWSKHKGENKVP